MDPNVSFGVEAPTIGNNGKQGKMREEEVLGEFCLKEEMKIEEKPSPVRKENKMNLLINLLKTKQVRKN